MESAKKEKVQGAPDGAAIISGIEADARTEEQQIIEEAKKQVAEKKKYAEQNIESILNDAHKEAQEKAEAVKKKMISSIQLELKRRSMRMRDVVIRDILNKAEKKLDTLISETSYRTIIINWITEAAIGLDTESARINASEKELSYINEQLISEVTEKILTKTGKRINLKLSEALPLKSQGVVLTAADGRTAFNNQVRTRMLRKEREIRMAIYNTLFAVNRKEE
jgi:vacuolar-type H+-ATPase subunit E/Vma4